MVETIHVGDCSTGCNRCAKDCAARNHRGCIGTKQEKAFGSWLNFINALGHNTGGYNI